MADFRFTNEHSSGDLGNIADVLMRPRLWIPTEADYPGHGEWVQKTEAQLANEEKRAMVAYKGRTPIGTIVYQRHQIRPNTVEIKNVSVSDDARGRFVGSFLLRNVEIESVLYDFPDCDTIVGDTKLTNTEVIRFVRKHGYMLEGVADLYGTGTKLDAIFSKTTVK